MFLDFTALPLLNIGIHGGYNHVSVGDLYSDTTKWFTLGAHATLVF